MAMHRARRFARLPVQVAVALATALLVIPAAAMAEPAQSRTSTDNSAPNGLVVVIANKPQENKLDLELQGIHVSFRISIRSRATGSF
jgi:hypothetical protein